MLYVYACVDAAVSRVRVMPAGCASGAMTAKLLGCRKGDLITTSARRLPVLVAIRRRY
jgi:hypothetical protein